jgi:hypothetical protein
VLNVDGVCEKFDVFNGDFLFGCHCVFSKGVGCITSSLP